ncbi:MAG: protein tyrosine phosphatase (PTP) superfamily phosphohydrolase (DUF442 family) [Oceanicoccus sp.]|jgi:protein tyrosine phosphatase (PTP) superfamily phosphohydrolase (DUF442 family)
MEILNTHQFSDTICSSGQPTVQQFDEIAARGYQAVINLAMPDNEHAIPTEGCIVSSHGMTYIHIPVPFDAPNEDHFDDFCGYMNTLKEKKVWVHCVVNARVSAFLYRYLQKEKGLNTVDATSPILKAWIPKMDLVWKNFISLE